MILFTNRRVYFRWWGSSKCSDGAKGGGEETAELELDHVAGMFFVLLAALLVGFCACLVGKSLGAKKKLAFLVGLHKFNCKDEDNFTS